LVLSLDARGPQDRMLHTQAGFVSPTNVPYVDPAAAR
jgi:hypothetical protein